MREIKLVVYRHKERKDIYMIRNWGTVGGGETTNFYEGTKDILEAIRNTNMKNSHGKFESWLSSFLGEDGKTKLVVKIKDRKEFEFDGYKGVAEKEIVLRCADFEKVELVERR